ncbi:hypothetical protein PLESTB_001421000 [Pleodorina starrii]|uniref:Uncharacterized protein n=1 Tax=Pleodorina starrii TaxID=330485 RepID=A0A9W6BVQ5_9CHLO|nr:hypothetical protein PLESTB_001421000 [Pleodorina starrii]
MASKRGMETRKRRGDGDGGKGGKGGKPPKAGGAPAAPAHFRNRNNTLISHSEDLPRPQAQPTRSGRPAAARQKNYNIDVGGALYCGVEGCKYNPDAPGWVNLGFITPSHAVLHAMESHGATVMDMYNKDLPAYPSGRGAPPDDASLEMATRTT